MTRQAGLTLIEILIGLLVLSLLAMAASPFTSRWSQENTITQSGTQVGEMIAIAKARAVLNSASVVADAVQDAVSVLCLNGRVLQVREAASSSPTMACDDANLVTTREAVLPQGAIVLGSNRIVWQCVCFNSRGLITVLDAACAACSTDLNFFIHAGAIENAQNYTYR
jgi:prepilin-type N-terminal cleavage/methylation domain-containing protein